MLTFTRKKRLAELVGTQLSMRFTLPRIAFSEHGAEILRHQCFAVSVALPLARTRPYAILIH